MTDRPQTFAGKLALVTGTSRGIGRATALELARRGADIIAVSRARSQGALEELDDQIQALGRKATLVPLDLAKGDDIDKLGAALYERFGKLDILIGNAAIIGSITPLAQVDPKDFQRLIDVNVTANWRLMRGMEPLLKAADQPSSVYITSSVARTPRAFWGSYAASKAALETLALTYAAESEHWGHNVQLVDPGRTATAMRASAVPGEDQSSITQPAEIASFICDLIAQRPSSGVHRYKINK